MQIEIMYGPPKKGDPEELESFFRKAVQDALRRLTVILESTHES